MRHVWIEATGQLVSIDDGKPADFCAVYQNGTVATGPEPLPKYAPEQPAAERIAVQQERIATLEGVLAENKRVLEIAMGTVARLSAPVSDAEINVFCWGFTEVVKARFDLIIAARTQPPASEQNAACSCTHPRSDHVGTVAEGSNAMPCIRCSCIQYKPT